MGSGHAGGDPLFAALWDESEIDGTPGDDPSALRVGARWRWTAPFWRLDVPPGPLRLEGAIGRAELHRVAAHRARRLTQRPGHLSVVADLSVQERRSPYDGVLRDTFVVSDGLRMWPVSHAGGEDGARRLLLFRGALPPPETDLWIVSVERAEAAAEPRGPSGFAPGTPIETPAGPVPIEQLRPKDLVITDLGARPVRAVLRRGRSAALALPPGLFGEDTPPRPVVLGPLTHIGLEGEALSHLWGLPEALVRAHHLRTLPGVQELADVPLVTLVVRESPLVMAGGLPYLAGPPEASPIRCLTAAEVQIAMARDTLRSGPRLVLRGAA